MDVKKSKAIRALEIKAKNDDVLSNFQLFNHYMVGRFVEKDESEANEYLNKVIELSGKFDFRFNELNLFNFRRFEKLSIKMSDTNLTVIIGNNGSGKTSILDAISKSLSWFVNNFLAENTTGQKLSVNDICKLNGASSSNIVSIVQLFKKNQFSVELAKSEKASDSKIQGDYSDFKLIADMYRYLNNRIDKFNLPLLAYYPTERTQSISQIQFNKIEKMSIEGWESVDGYDGSLSAHQNFNRFLGWYKRISNIELSTNNIYNKKKSELDIKKGFISIFEDSYDKETNSENVMYVDLQSQIKSLEQELVTLQVPASKTLQFINSSIMEFIPEISNIRHENWPEDGFFVDKAGISLEARQLSQGERVSMALVGDITRRLILLNPSLPNPLEGTGIVLIDEIDLHIHPTWQQKVIPKLLKTFPNLQFIITTHSPQVLSTVEVGSIRMFNINKNDKPTINSPIFQTRGAASADIMAQLMETTSVADVPESGWVKKYEQLLIEGDYKKSELFFNKILAHFGELHPVIYDCKNLLKLAEIKNNFF